MHFEIVSDRECLIDGIGLLPVNAPVVLDDDDLKLFQAMNNVSITEAKFPRFVSIVAVLDEGGEK